MTVVEQMTFLVLQKIKSPFLLQGIISCSKERNVKLDTNTCNSLLKIEMEIFVS